MRLLLAPHLVLLYTVQYSNSHYSNIRLFGRFYYSRIFVELFGTFSNIWYTKIRIFAKKSEYSRILRKKYEYLTEYSRIVKKSRYFANIWPNIRKKIRNIEKNLKIPNLNEYSRYSNIRYSLPKFTIRE